MIHSNITAYHIRVPDERSENVKISLLSFLRDNCLSMGSLPIISSKKSDSDKAACNHHKTKYLSGRNILERAKKIDICFICGGGNPKAKFIIGLTEVFDEKPNDAIADSIEAK